MKILCFFIGIGILGIVFNLCGSFYTIKFLLYLKKNYYEKWKKLTSGIPFFMSPALSRYVFSDEDNGDNEIQRLKKRIILSGKYCSFFLGIGFLLPILFFLILLLVFMIKNF